MAKYKIKRRVEIEEEVDCEQYIAFKIRELRKAKKWTQQEFADELRLSRTSIAHIEKTHRPVLIKNLYKICQVLGVKSSEILPF